MRQAVEDIIGRGTQAPTGHIPFTPRSKKVLELSLREALQLGSDYIGTEHILLALVREGDGVGAQVLVAPAWTSTGPGSRSSSCCTAREEDAPFLPCPRRPFRFRAAALSVPPTDDDLWAGWRRSPPG